MLHHAERTPLHLTAFTGQFDHALLLLRVGADLEAVDIHGWSCKQIAEYHHHQAYLSRYEEYVINRGYDESSNNHSHSDRIQRLKSMNMNSNSFLSTTQYSSTLWVDMVRMKAQQKLEFLAEKKSWEKTVEDVNKAREKIIQYAAKVRDSEKALPKVSLPPLLRVEDAVSLQEMATELRSQNLLPVRRLAVTRKQKPPKLSAIQRSDNYVRSLVHTDDSKI